MAALRIVREGAVWYSCASNAFTRSSARERAHALEMVPKGERQVHARCFLQSDRSPVKDKLLLSAGPVTSQERKEPGCPPNPRHATAQPVQKTPKEGGTSVGTSCASWFFAASFATFLRWVAVRTSTACSIVCRNPPQQALFLPSSRRNLQGEKGRLSRQGSQA